MESLCHLFEDRRHRLHLLLLLLLLIAISSLISMSDGGQHEKRLLDHLFNQRKHNRLERPVADETQPLVVHFGLVLQQIIDVEEKNEIISTNLWLNLAWNDYSMGWNESEFGGIKTLRIPASLLWRPDILMYNSADEDIDSTFPTNVVLSSSGNCLWVPPGLFRSTCKMDITWFPFDDQMCSLKFGSWTYDSRGIDLQLQQTTNGEEGGGGGGGGDLSSFIPNGEWMLIEMPVERNVKSYDCCPEEYIDVTFTIHIRRRTLYYGFNLIIPCVLISSMALLTFTLPPDAGEKISLGVTILLSLTVFLLLVAETMPPTSDAVPLIGMYFASIMLMCSLSVVFTVLVLNCHFRSPETHQMPTWVRKGICEWLAAVLFVRKPEYGKTAPPNRRHFRSRDTKSVGASKSRKLFSKSLDVCEDLIMINNGSKTRKQVTRCRSTNNTTTADNETRGTGMSKAQRMMLVRSDPGDTPCPDPFPFPSLLSRHMMTVASKADEAQMASMTSSDRRRSRNRKEEQPATGNRKQGPGRFRRQVRDVIPLRRRPEVSVFPGSVAPSEEGRSRDTGSDEDAADDVRREFAVSAASERRSSDGHRRGTEIHDERSQSGRGEGEAVQRMEARSHSNRQTLPRSLHLFHLRLHSSHPLLRSSYRCVAGVRPKESKARDPEATRPLFQQKYGDALRILRGDSVEDLKGRRVR